MVSDGEMGQVGVVVAGMLCALAIAGMTAQDQVCQWLRTGAQEFTDGAVSAAISCGAHCTWSFRK